MDKITGKIDENELEILAGDEIVGGGSPAVASIIISAVIVATYAAGACPTSACTKSCNK